MKTVITNDEWIKNMHTSPITDHERWLQKRLDNAMEWESVLLSLPYVDDETPAVGVIVATESEVFVAEFTNSEKPIFYDHDRRGNVTPYVTHWMEIKRPK